MADRRTPFDNAGEREMLVEFLDYLRESVVLKASGLDPAAAKQPRVPSGTSLLGLVKHLTMVEVAWFQYAFAGEAVAIPALQFEDGDTPESVIAAYEAATRCSNEIVAACDDLDQLAVHAATAPQRMSLRWLLVHMIEETGRHAGHADILRELTDGSTGR